MLKVLRTESADILQGAAQRRICACVLSFLSGTSCAPLSPFLRAAKDECRERLQLGVMLLGELTYRHTKQYSLLHLTRRPHISGLLGTLSSGSTS